ncbi:MULTISPECIES: hypothetical protein [unclassified Clostridium]|uniref:hypothetical protein n=1 Tax=unclassified Clostridium TaxID=2614128 RepID=UPI0015FDE7C0|nr:MULTISPECIES: hypothetical protein [unclassified Clostridium]
MNKDEEIACADWARWLISIALFAEVDNFKENGKEDMNDKIRRRIKVGCEG